MREYLDHHRLALKQARSRFRPEEEEHAKTGGARWLRTLGLDSSLHPPGTSNPNRDELFKLALDPQHDTVALCASILAWGGMRADHGRALFAIEAKWRNAVETLRYQPMTRSEAYTLMKQQRIAGNFPGMGPAYFTKLIFFLRGKSVADKGYIMDQWTGCSINLLAGSLPVVLMEATYTWINPQETRSSFRVSDQNGPARYESFCAAIDLIADELCLDGINAELLLMSQGRGQGEWREHVLKHRQPPKAPA